MARAAGITEIIVPIGGSPVRLVTPKQWRRAVRQGEIERSTKITREHRLTASSEEIAVATMRADECSELQPMLDEILGPEPVAEVSTPEPSEPETQSAPPSPPPSSTSSSPSSTGPVSVPTTAPVTTRELQRNRDEVKAQLAALEERFAKNAPVKAAPLSGALTAPGSSAQPNSLPSPPAPDPSPPPTLPETEPNSGGNLLRWLMMYPGAVIGSFLTWLLLVWVAGFLTFDLFFLEAIAAFVLGSLGVSLYAHIGMAIAPKKNRLSKWLLIAPYLPIWALMCLAIFISIGDGPIAPEEFSSNVLFSLDELSPRWQLIWYGLGYAIGGFSIMKEPASSYE